MNTIPISAMFFHYAPLSYLPRIVESGLLLPSNAGGANDEIPLLWFSKNQTWKPTATKSQMTPSGIKRLTFKEQRELFGCIRFGLPRNDKRLIDWRTACKVASISKKERLLMESVGRDQGANPLDWFATVDSIQLTELHFQFLTDSWHDADPVDFKVSPYATS
ncbi:hypothetical protein [Thiothrix subterranea]|uniref:hypothetical protein n=1 Tax=Thiothrix subterranea TaxID=2735563 RepID=UPI00280A7DCF|nr:hypothetical protein [Thiothrix subterranea]